MLLDRHQPTLFSEFMQTIAIPLAQIDADVMISFDTDFIMRSGIKSIGMPTKILKDKAKVDRLIKEREAAQQGANQMANALEASEIQKNIGSAIGNMRWFMEITTDDKNKKKALKVYDFFGNVSKVPEEDFIRFREEFKGSELTNRLLFYLTTMVDLSLCHKEHVKKEAPLLADFDANRAMFISGARQVLELIKYLAGKWLIAIQIM